MNPKITSLATAALLSLTLLSADAETALKLPALFCEHMILQRNQAAPVWGWAAPGEVVTVDFAGQQKKVIAGTDENRSIRVEFTHAQGLHVKNGSLKWFAIAGTDGKFVWADAKIDGETIVVSSPHIPVPVAVRYAWAANPEGCNLFNGAGLPASPFRSDSW